MASRCRCLQIHSRRRPPAWPQSFQSITGTALAALERQSDAQGCLADCSFFHPDDVIKDHVVDSQSITEMAKRSHASIRMVRFCNYSWNTSNP
eukprot:scaffold39153_cov77-Skeletonema_marinoi.AAC.1